MSTILGTLVALLVFGCLWAFALLLPPDAWFPAGGVAAFIAVIAGRTIEDWE